MANPVAKRIGRQIKKARWEADLTQREVAAALNVDAVSFSRWEQGHRIPRVEDLIKMASFFALPIGYFTGEYESDLDQARREVKTAASDRVLAAAAI